jgi:O-antigen ligase
MPPELLRKPPEIGPPPHMKSNRKSHRLRSFGFHCALALIFLRYSFLSDFFTYLTGKETYVLYIFGPPALLAFLASGGMTRTFREKGPKFWLAFTVWMCLGVPFSIWRGNSTQLALNYVRTVFPLLLFIVGLTVRWTECRKMIYAIAAASMFNSVLGLLFLRPGEERFSVNWSGSIGNSNDFAAHLLMTVPFLLFIVLRPGMRLLIRLACLAPVLLGLFEILRTASRGALIALVVTVLFLLLRGSMRQRIAIGAAAVIALVSIITFLPASTWNRMLSFSSEEAGANKEALDSSRIREDLLRESIKCTLEHPILGVGLGQFGFYESVGRSQPGHVGWRPTHNSYTEISSECGIPALLFYLAALVWAFVLLARIRKRAFGPYKNEIVAAAYAIRVAVIAYSVAIFFINFGYAFEFLVVSGLIEAMWRAVRDNRTVEPGTSAAKARALRLHERMKNLGRKVETATFV